MTCYFVIMGGHDMVFCNNGAGGATAWHFVIMY